MVDKGEAVSDIYVLVLTASSLQGTSRTRRVSRLPALRLTYVAFYICLSVGSGVSFTQFSCAPAPTLPRNPLGDVLKASL